MSEQSVESPTIEVPVGTSLEQVERQMIERTFSHFGGNRKKTADALGISLKTLYNKLRQYAS